MPAFKFSLLLISGILIGSEFIFRMNILIAIIFLILALIAILLKRKANKNIILLLTSFLIILFGILKANIDFFMIPENSISGISDTPKKSKYILEGIITEIPDKDSSRIRFILGSRKIISDNNNNNHIKDTIKVTGDLIVTVRKNMYRKQDVSPPVFAAGDLVILKGQLSDAPSQRNPGEFDYKKYLSIHNIYKTFSVSGYENAIIISHDNLNFFSQSVLYPAKIFALRNIDENMSGDEASYLKGLVTGERSGITEEMKNSFINAGVMHLIAVSGLNVAYIIISLTLILSILRIPSEARTIIIIFLLIFYCMFTGNTASILRATIMGILVLLSHFIERKINFYNTIGVAAMIILIYDSKQLFDAGFILSFSATLSMVIIYSIFERVIVKLIEKWTVQRKKFTLWLSAIFFTSLAAQCGTLPLTAFYFGKISVISVFANIIAVPLANFSLAIGFFQIITASFSEYLSSVIAETNNLLLGIQIGFIKWCASLDFSFIPAGNFGYPELICYYLILTIILTSKRLREIFFRMTICALILTGLIIYNIDFTKKLRITFLDVGQGDCALIQTPDDKVLLVDCGTMTFTFNSGERTIAPYLKRIGIKKIDLLIITHLHNDHIGGINYLLDNFIVGEIIESGQNFKTPFIDTMNSIIEGKHIKKEIVRSGDFIDDIEDIRMYFVFPTDDFVNKDGFTINNNLNNGSVAFILKYKDAKIFFGGDIEKEAERFLYDTYSDFLKTDILKVAHHGSYTSSTIPFLIKNRPAFAVISCGMYNKFNHPSDIVLRRLQNINTKFYRTDLEGAVIMESDGYSVNQVEWK